MSKKLMDQHQERENLGLTEREMIVKIRKEQRENVNKGN